MLSGRIEAGLTWSDFVVVRLLRRWAAVRSLGDNALPSLVALAAELGESPQVAISLHSLFQLTESCLGRPLVAECCCSRSLAPDERATLTMIASVSRQMPLRTTRAVPHGLPAALAWAAATARLMLRGEISSAAQQECPFVRG